MGREMRHKSDVLSFVEKCTFLRTRLAGIPHAFAFSSDSEKVYYLAADSSRGGRQALFVYFPKWNKSNVLVSSLPVDQQTLTLEETLLRERLRQTGTGITSFVYCPSKDYVLFASGNNMFYADCSCVTETSLDLIPQFLTSCANGDAFLDLKCSSDGSFLTYVLGKHLYVFDMVSRTESCVTVNAESVLGETGEKVAYGMAEFIMQEEFDLVSGSSLQPSGQAILFRRVDSSPVGQVLVVKPKDPAGVDSYAYPLAGTPNALVSLFVAYLGRSNDSAPMAVTGYAPVDLSRMDEKWEYITRMGWSSSGAQFWFELMDRLQRNRWIFSCDFSSHADRFVPVLAYHETSSTWINTDNHTFMMANGDFVIGSETLCSHGLRNLFLLTRRSADAVPVSADTLVPRYEVARCITRLSPILDSSVPMDDFSQIWQVDGRSWINESQRRIFFTANRDSAVESHVYMASFASSECQQQQHDGVIRVTSTKRMVDAVSFNGPRRLLVYCTSSRSEPHRIFLQDVLGADDALEISHPYCGVPAPSVCPIAWPQMHPPQMFSFCRTSGNKERLFGCYYLPPDYAEPESQSRFPVLVYVYGGPHVQLVSESYSLTMWGRMQMYASQGYVVVMVDGAGSFRRGQEFEATLYRRLGHASQLQDQIDGLQYLQEEVKLRIDLGRVGIFGFSYGGYMSLLAMCQYPHFFNCASAGAPVVDWRLYDTGYTERYMERPSDNAQGYIAGNVVEHTDTFPDSMPPRLMIVHGSMDENVLFKHTECLIDALVEAGKPHDLVVLMAERHGLRRVGSNVWYDWKQLDFFDRHLQPKTRRPLVSQW
eukprot:ANDGO_06500.mRNA.1 Dipeptidyl aminopeptidase 4